MYCCMSATLDVGTVVGEAVESARGVTGAPHGAVLIVDT